MQNIIKNKIGIQIQGKGERELDDEKDEEIKDNKNSSKITLILVNKLKNSNFITLNNELTDLKLNDMRINFNKY